MHKCTATIIKEHINEPPIEIQYPRVRGLHNRDAELRINHAIKNLIQRQIDILKQQEEPDFRLAGLSGNYEITVNRNCILSIRFEFVSYFERAAHPMTIVDSLTFNLKTGESYRLDDLFKPGGRYRLKINRIIKKQIKKRDIPLLGEFEGISDNQGFYLTDSNLVIYYQIYDLAPYVFGIPEFPISFEYLSHLVRPGSPIEALLNRSK